MDNGREVLPAGDCASVLHTGVLHVEHLLLLFQLLLVEDATFCPEEDGGHPGEEGAHHRQAKGPGEKVVLVTGHPVTVIAANAKHNHRDGAEEGWIKG